MAENAKRRRRRRRTGSKKAFLVLLALVSLVLGGVKLRYALSHRNLPGSNVSAPDFVTVDYIPTNEYSRPGTPLREISGVVVHYVGNPGTTAAANRSFFANLALTHETYASAHFVVGLILRTLGETAGDGACHIIARRGHHQCQRSVALRRGLQRHVGQHTQRGLPVAHHRQDVGHGVEQRAVGKGQAGRQAAQAGAAGFVGLVVAVLHGP